MSDVSDTSDASGLLGANLLASWAGGGSEAPRKPPLLGALGGSPIVGDNAKVAPQGGASVGANPLLPPVVPSGASAEAAKRMVLDKISSGEATRYNELYKGGSFESYADHPRIRQVITEGPHKGETSDAAGKYQFLSSTYDGEKAKLGLRDFSPASQDAAAWDLAQSTYRTAAGRDLLADAQGGKVDYAKLSGQWPSLANGGSATEDWRTVATKSGLTAEQVASLTPSEVAQFKQLADANAGSGRSERSGGGSTQEGPTTSAGASPGSPAEAIQSQMKLTLLRNMFPQHAITPVEYDPWKELPKGLGGPVNVNEGVS